jgi:beta-galactosidase
MKLLSVSLLFVALGLFAFSIAEAYQESRQTIRLDDDWKFMLGDPLNAAEPGFDDSTWRVVTLLHDWRIESKIDPTAPNPTATPRFL